MHFAQGEGRYCRPRLSRLKQKMGCKFSEVAQKVARCSLHSPEV
ncbi:hypothetical protein GCWU000325_00650 [Alloprevotella tannerae ATCC 51259]|uniref:Uncharacterized protein n=1 Tax=Alloprevotella tannerae ATCC 51259 TaxID=626522 RepID=C9LEM0_9BACT|nr:hypothetical protein GCWU000325_00650 [Alloprevotella tannerae ATCC 51259]